MPILLSLFAKPYFMTLESFKQQFAGVVASQYKDGTAYLPAGHLHIPIFYKRNPLIQIKVTDKDNNPVVLYNGQNIEIKFTYVNAKFQHKRTSMFFDTIVVTDKTVTGGQSRFMPFIKKTIQLDTVTKIEVKVLGGRARKK